MDGKQEVQNGKGVHWVTDPLAERPIPLKGSGPESIPPSTVISKFIATSRKFSTRPALAVKRNGQWKKWSWQQYHDDVMMAARGLLFLGAEKGHGIAIIGFNSPEWFIADLASIFCGSIAAPIYTTNQPDAVKYIADHCKARVAIVENEIQAKKFLSVRKDLPELRAIVQWSGKLPEGDQGIPIYSWEDFLKLGEKVSQEDLQKKMDEQSPSRCCTLIYTSGTTGPPKGVMVSHDNITWVATVVSQLFHLTEEDQLISYLPLSHIAAQMVDLHSPMYTGATVWFAQPDALKGSLGETLKEVRPTVFLGVPRVWEKIQEKMLQVGKSVTGFKRTIADWAKSVGLQANYAIQNNQSTPWGFWAADYVIFSKIKQALGLDRCRLAGSAAAPIAKETLEYFMSINIPIFEIYGMSECTGPQTICFPGKWRTGSCGPSIPGSELKIADPDKDGNGEVCYRGRHVFLGYMYNDKETASAIDNEGFLHSGDIGVMRDGFLYITGRIKELIITAGGENIPPVLIEDEIMKEIGKVAANIMLVGDRRKFLMCLLTLRLKNKASFEHNEYPFTDELADGVVEILKSIGSSSTTATEAMTDTKLADWLTQGITKANKRATSNAQVVQKFILIPKDFTIEGGELTPSLKLKRKIVAEQYKDQINKLYAEAELQSSQN